MTTYKCRVSDASGRKSEVIKSAPTEQSLIKQFNDENLFLISYSENNKKRRRFGYSSVLDFTDTMALMLHSGLSVKDALKVASSLFTNKKTGELINSISGSLNKGKSFPESIDEMSRDFSPLYRGLVRIGDRTGSMEAIFQKLSNYMNNEKKMKEKIQSALMYPILVVSVLFLGIGGVFLFILPKIQQTFLSDNLDAVFLRFQILLMVILIPAIIAVGFILFLYIASRTGGRLNYFSSLLLLKIPLWGKLTLTRSVLNMMFSLEVLSESGYSVESALDESSNVLGNTVLMKAVADIRKAIIRGDRLSDAFRRETVFPERISVWIGIGEASGDVSSVFSQLRRYFQGELDKMTSRIMLLVEPALIVAVGIFMILFVILFIVPLFSIFGAAI